MNMRPLRPKTPRKTPHKSQEVPVEKDPIQVYCRLRPLDNNTNEVCLRIIDGKTVLLSPPEDGFKYGKGIQCSFEHVFSETTSQKEIFNQVALPLVQDVLNGTNGLLFTYGITSSGKTFTMTGTPQDCGLLPRTLDAVFNSIKDYQAPKFTFKIDCMNGFEIQTTDEARSDRQKELGLLSRTPKSKRRDNSNEWACRTTDPSVIQNVSSDMNYSVFVTYIEIYNKYIYDLLEEGSDIRGVKRNCKILREDKAGNVYVFTVVESEVKNADEALELFNKGQLRRKVSNTGLNSESSRSHSVFTIRVVQAPLDRQGAEILQDKEQLIISQLSLVDLAGSERQVRTRNFGSNLREAGNINNSLMALRKCIENLRNRQGNLKVQAPGYREDKLIHLFKPFFEGEGRIRMIVCANPQADNYHELIHVLKFAEMTRDVVVPRPTPIKTPNTYAFKSGRGNLYRDAIKTAKATGVPVSEILAPAVYSLGPGFPRLSISFSDDESVYDNLMQFLDSRTERRNQLRQDLDRRHEEFRKTLVSMEKDLFKLRQERTIAQMDLDARNQQFLSFEQKLASSEQEREILERQLIDQQNKSEATKIELEATKRKNSELSRENQLINGRRKQDITDERQRWKRIMQCHLAAKEAEFEGKKCHMDEVMRQLQGILNAAVDSDPFQDMVLPPMDSPAPSTDTLSEFSDVVPATTRGKRRSLEAGLPDAKFMRTRSDNDFVHKSRQDTPQSRQPSSTRNDFDALFMKENKAPGSSQRSVAIANLRHRRTQSSTSAWIEHKPVGNLELNTVMQPKMKKKKSVSKLTKKDVTKNDKYVLQHQEQDSQGEIETQLFKGDILPSAGGGAQVVFNDVEKLRQASPPAAYNLRKRSSGENINLREVGEKCSVSVECHGAPSRVLRKK